MSLHIPKLCKSPLDLAAAAFVIHVGAATAADSTGDIQQQMKDVLAGTTAHSAPHSAPREGNSMKPTADAQEFVKQLLVGTTGPRVGDAEVATPRARPVANGDMQAAVRQFLLGQPHASDAS